MIDKKYKVYHLAVSGKNCLLYFLHNKHTIRLNCHEYRSGLYYKWATVTLMPKQNQQIKLFETYRELSQFLNSRSEND